jgi:hypothetical protein
MEKQILEQMTKESPSEAFNIRPKNHLMQSTLLHIH